MVKLMDDKGFFDTAAREGLLAVAEGSNVDDEGDYRPGMKAIAELGVKSPLREAGLKKQEINDKLHGMGFAYVALDLKGYRTGSLNEVLK